MVKVIIADDKFQERDYIVDFIRRTFHKEMEIVHVAQDGEEVLSHMHLQPDLLILDIQMPKIDGLEVASQVMRSLPEVKTVLVTAFAEFSYAKEAIKLGVSEYLLKPYTDSELQEVLEKVILSLTLEKKDRVLSKKEHPLLFVDSFLEEALVQKVLDRKVDPRTLTKHLTRRFDSHRFFKAVVLFSEDAPMMEEKTMDLVRGFFERKPLSLLSDLEGKEKVLLLFGEKKEDFQDLDASIKRTVKFFSEGLHETVYVGVSRFYENPEDLKSAYEEAAAFITEYQAFTVKDAYEKNQRYEKAMKNSEKMLKMHVMNKEKEKMLSDLSVYVSEVLEKSPETYQIRRMAYLSYELILSVHEVLGSGENGEQMVRDLLTEGYSLEKTLAENRTYFMELILHLMEELENLSVYHNVTLVKEAKAFILEHFREKITLKDTASAVGVSFGHLSKCFNKVEGTSFNSFLLKVRMEEAVKLFQTGERSITDIAYETGVGDPNYFSKCFKKHTGMTPKEYQKELQLLKARL